jgi:protein-arginine kinase activator protein McsA
MELLNLRQQLDAAVQSEDYELAARLRDKIKQSEQ